MLGNIFKWLAERIGGSAEQEIEKAVETTIEAGRFAVELSQVEVGQTATAPKVTVRELGKEFQIDIRATRTA